MLIIPKATPVIDGLNSYYLYLDKLVEHYQGEIGSGAIHLKGISAEGIMFFDGDELLSGIYEVKGETITGKEAIGRLFEATGTQNFTLTILPIEAEMIYFWANLPEAEEIYRDLSTDFTDLDGLIKKLRAEKLTGFIHASLENGEEDGLIFFSNGEITGGSYPPLGDSSGNLAMDHEHLIKITKELGAVFHVSKITGPGDSKNVPADLGSLEELMAIFKGVLRSDKDLENHFETLFRKKLLEKADKYAFLDPFAAEFSYEHGKIAFQGNATDRELFRGILETVKDLSEELGVRKRLTEETRPWANKYVNRKGEWNLEV